jgi:hypothetical protein
MTVGRKTGGRRLGGKNLRTKAHQAVIDAAAAAGEMPLEYMLGIMRNKKQKPARRDDMAKAAAPYCHPRLSKVEVGGKNDGPIEGRITVEFVEPKKRKA